MSNFSCRTQGKPSLYIKFCSACAILITLALPPAYAGVVTNLTVTINQQVTQADPVPLNGKTSTQFVAVFSASVLPGSFTVSDVKTTGSTATGIVVESVTEMAPMNGTTFEIIASATSTGTIVLSLGGDGVGYTPTTAKSYSTPTNPSAMATYQDKVYVGTYNGGGLYEINTTTNTSRLLSNLNGDAVFGTLLVRDGLIYVAGYQTGYINILRMTTDGVLTKLTTINGLHRYITVDSAGNIYGTSTAGIIKISPAGVVSTWVSVSSLNEGISIDAQGNIYVKQTTGTMLKVAPDGSYSATTSGSLAYKIVGTDSYFMGVSPLNAKKTVEKKDAQGNISTVFDLSKPHPGILDMTGYSVAPDGKLVIYGSRADGKHVIFVYDPATNTSQEIIAVSSSNPTAISNIAASATGIFYENNSGFSYQVASGAPVATVTDVNGTHSQPSTSTDNVVTIKSAADMQAIAQAKIVAYANDNTNPGPTLNDYTYIGVTGVTPENLSIVNVFVDASTGPDVDTTQEVQALVDAINVALAAISVAQDKIVAYANNNTNPAPTLEDYQTLGIAGVTANNVAVVNARVDTLTGVDVDTALEVQALVDEVNAAQANIVAYANNNANPAPTLADYQVIGVTGVTANSLAAVNAKVDALTGTDVDTTPEVQALVNAVIATQAKIVAYANDKTQPAPTVTDYATIGVAGVTADNLAAVNAKVDALTGVDVDTQPEVQALVDVIKAAQAKIVAYANDNTQPAPTVADYTAVGVTGVTTTSLAGVNAKVDSLTGVDVDTRPEIQAVVDGVNAVNAAQAKIVAYANDKTQPAPTSADYALIGVTGVTAGNLADVNAKVDLLTGVDVDTKPEVQAVVNALIAAQAKMIAYANSNANPAPAIADYVALGVQGVTTGNLATINARVDVLTGTDVDTQSEVQALVSAVTAALAKIVAYANDNTQPAPTVADYTAIGVTGVTTVNLAAVNTMIDRLIGTEVDTAPEVQAVVNTLNAAQANIVAYATSNTNPAPTLLDYQTIGVVGVTASNLTVVNAKVDALTGVDVDTPPEVQVWVNALVKTLEYTLRRSADGRYHVYMRPTVSSANYPSLSGQITLAVPHSTGSSQFVVSSLQSAISGVSWTQTSRADAPVENTGVDYLSFTFSPSGATTFTWQAGVELEVFNFLATNTCTGTVGVMSNSDAFNQLPNSKNTSPGNQFTNLGWGSSTTNNYLGNYGSSVDCANALAVQVRGFLQGAFLSNVPLMRDSLRTANLIPTAQPYGVAPFSYVGTETLQPTLLSVLDTTAIVDWVLVELRDKSVPATRVAAKAALLRRDGTVVDAQTGSTTLSFPNQLTNNYYVVLRHRNHLGVMSKTALALTSSPTLVDFTLPTTETYGETARTTSGGVALLWAGDANGDNQVIANGPGNDLSNVLTKVLMSSGNAQLNVNYLLSGYDSSDFNLSGETIFAGPNNDANVVIGNILMHPQNSSFSGNYIIHGTVP